MNEYEISKLKRQLQRKQELLKEEKADRQQTQKLLVQASAERDKYHTQLMIARKQIQNIDKIIAENVRSMKAKLDEENSIAINQLKDLKEKISAQRFLNERITQENANKDAIITQLSARLRQMSKKYKDPSLLVNTKEISEQAMLTHNQFYKLTQKYNKLSKDMENIMAENKILRKLHGVPDNFGFDLEQIKIAEKQQLQDYKAQCRKLQTEIEELQAERTQLRYRLRQYNTLYSNKGDRYKDMTQQQLQLLDLYAINLKEGKFQLPQIDKSQKQMERQILKLRAQVQVLQNKYPVSMVPGNTTANVNTNQKINNQQMKKFQQQIKSYLQPFVKDMKKLSETNINGLINNLQNIQNASTGKNQMASVNNSNFKGPIPLPIAHNDWSVIKEGYSFMYSSKIPVDMKDLENDVSFDVMKAKYEIAALQLQNIESLKLLKQKQKVQNQLSKELFDLKDKYKKCLRVQDQLFIRYFKDKQAVNDRIKKLQIQKYQLSNQKRQLQSKVDIITTSNLQMSRKGDIQRKLNQFTSRLAISEAQVLKLQRRYQILQDQEKMLRQTYSNLEKKMNDSEYTLKQKLIHAKNNERELAGLVNKILDEVKGSVSAEAHDSLLDKMQLMNDKSSNLMSKQTQLRLKIQKLESIQRETSIKNDIIQNLREDNLQILLQLEIVKNRLRTVDINYRTYCDVFDRFITFINENNTSLMKCFKTFDADKSGNLTKKQLGDALKSLRFVLTQAQLDLLYDQFDLDGSDSVSYKQFVKKMRRRGANSRTKQEEAVLKLFKAIKHSKISIRRAFQIIDKDGSRQITKSQMASAFSQIGITTTQQTVNCLFKLCDYDGDEKITCPQLERLYRQIIRQADVVQKQIYSEQIDWKLAFVLKLEEVSVQFKSSLAQTFKKLDDDGNSVLTMTELAQFIKKAGMTIESSAIRQLFDFLDRRKDGQIQFGQFLKILSEAKSQKQRIQRIKYIKQRTNQLKIESQAIINSKSFSQNQPSLNKNYGQAQKLKIRVQALTAKQSNMLKRNGELAEQLAKNQQKTKELERNLEIQRNEKMANLDKYHEQRLSKLTSQTLNQIGRKQDNLAIIRKQFNQLNIRNIQITNDLQLYKGLYEGLSDKNKGEQLRIGKIQAQRNKYYDIVKQLQGSSDINAEVGKLHIQIQYSKRNEEIINSKYDKIIEDLRKVDSENRKLSDMSTDKQKEILNTHMFFLQKCKLQQMKIDNLTLKIIPTVTIDKMQEYMIKLRQISNNKSSLQQQNRGLRQQIYNLQARNDYVQNQRVHIEQLQRKLRNQYTDDNSKTIIELTKKLSDYKMAQLRAKRELGLLKQKQEYYLRVHNTQTDGVKQLEEQLSNWEVKFNERQQFWRKRLSDQIKLMEQFQKQANRAKQQQLASVNYFSQKKNQQQNVNKKYQNLSQNNYNNISQFIKNEDNNHGDNDEYTEDLLQKIENLQQELISKQKQIHHLKSTFMEMVPQKNISKLMDFGSQMNVGTNSLLLQTQLTGSQLKNNARRFLNNQKQIQVYYKQQNARITQAAQQSIETLQRIIDDKNEQLRKKERMIQDLKRQFNEITEKDCLQIQKLNQQIRQLRSSKQMGNINEIMARTTNKNFYTSKAEGKLEQYQKLVSTKDEQIKYLQQKYDKLLISKSSAQNQKVASKNALNSEKLKLKLEELNEQRQMQKRKFQSKQKQLHQQVSNLTKVAKAKTAKIQQLNNALKDIKNDIVYEKSQINQTQAEENLKLFVKNMTKGTSKNDAAMEQFMQSALIKIKVLEGKNGDLRDELSRAKDAMGKTVNRLGK